MNKKNKVTIEKIAAAYSRVSTSNQEDQETIKNQIMAMNEYAKKNHISIVEEYIDDGWSGDILARPELDRLRQDVKSKKWEAVLIYDPDRLARRYSYQALITEELEEAGIEVIYVTTDAPKNSEDKIFHGMKGLFAEYERAKISERFRLGKLRKLDEGHVLTTEAPYGYKYIPKKDKIHGYYEVDEAEARVVRMIFSWVANEGLTLRTIVRKLQSLGIKPRKSKRGVWNTSTLSTLLRNEVYIGRAHWGSTEAVVPENPIKKVKYKKMKKTSRKVRPKEDWKYVDVPPIIDKDQFERAEAQLKKNFAQCKRNKKNDYLLSNFIYCTCGRRRNGEGVLGGKHLYYRCTDRVLSYPLPRKCFEKGVNARVADELVWKKVSSLMSNKELLKKQVERYLREQSKKLKYENKDLQVLEKELLKLKKEEERYNKAYGAGVFDLDTLKEYTGTIREQISGIKVQIDEVKKEKDLFSLNSAPTEKQIEEFATRSASMLKRLDFTKKREIAVKIIDKVEATKHSLQVYGKIPVTNYVEYKTSNRNSQCAIRHIKTIPFSFRIKIPTQ